MRLNRRSFLRAAGVALALPVLEASTRGQTPPAPRRRMMFICTPLGLHGPNLFPRETGREYQATPYLEVLKDYREDLTVMSGLAHPGVNFGHESIYSYLTTVPHPGRAGFRNTISVDQLAAERLGGETRFASLSMASEGFGLSWTRSGALVPSDTSPARLFARLFLDGRPDEMQAAVRRIQDGRSILDQVGEQARRLQSDLGARDREKLDEYFSSVRELERNLARSEEWSRRPRPRVNVAPPRDIPNSADLVGRTRLWFDLAHLAFETDSTRIITLLLGGASLVPPIPGVTFDHHNLSHHGQDPTKLDQLKTVESEKLKIFAEFLGKMKQTREEGVPLLDRSMILFGSNLGNASNHSCRDLPMLLAGGGFRHGQHLAFTGPQAPPLANLYVSMLQRLGVPTDRFGSGTSTLTGLSPVG